MRGKKKYILQTKKEIDYNEQKQKRKNEEIRKRIEKTKQKTNHHMKY